MEIDDSVYRGKNLTMEGLITQGVCSPSAVLNLLVLGFIF